MRFKSIGAAFVAVLAISAATAASANAAAEFLGGGFPYKFEGTIGSASLSTPSSPSSLTCTSASTVGELTSATSGTVTVALTGCAFEAVKCSTAGDEKGHILATLGITDVAEEENSKLLLGLLLETKSKISITCGVVTITVEGSITGEGTEYAEASGEALKAVPMPTIGTAGLLLLVKVVWSFALISKGKPAFGRHTLKAEFGKGPEEAGFSFTDTLVFTEKRHIDY